MSHTSDVGYASVHYGNKGPPIMADGQGQMMLSSRRYEWLAVCSKQPAHMLDWSPEIWLRQCQNCDWLSWPSPGFLCTRLGFFVVLLYVLYVF